METSPEAFVNLVQALFQKDVFSYQFLLNTLDDSPESQLLEKCGIVTAEKVGMYKVRPETSDKDEMTQVYTRTDMDRSKRQFKFKTYYTQTKFSLFREEN